MSVRVQVPARRFRRLAQQRVLADEPPQPRRIPPGDDPRQLDARVEPAALEAEGRQVGAEAGGEVAPRVVAQRG